MNNFINKIFSGFNREKRKKKESNAKILSNMPENVLYGEDTGAIPSEELKNQLDHDIK